MAFEFNRNQQDANYETTATLAQGGVDSTGFDLEQAIGGDIEPIVGELVIPAVAGITDDKVLTFTLEDSADNSTYAAIDPATTTTVTGTGGGGSPAKTVRFRFPPNTRQYVRIAQTADATAGTFTGDLTFRILF